MRDSRAPGSVQSPMRPGLREGSLEAWLSRPRMRRVWGVDELRRLHLRRGGRGPDRCAGRAARLAGDGDACLGVERPLECPVEDARRRDEPVILRTCANSAPRRGHALELGHRARPGEDEEDVVVAQEHLVVLEALAPPGRTAAPARAGARARPACRAGSARSRRSGQSSWHLPGAWLDSAKSCPQHRRRRVDRASVRPRNLDAGNYGRRASAPTGSSAYRRRSSASSRVSR